MVTPGQHILSEALEASGLPEDPRSIVGETFTLEDDGHVICGTVLSIGYGSTEGIKLYVSAPRFRGEFIDYLFYSHGVWVVQPPDRGITDKPTGALELMVS